MRIYDKNTKNELFMKAVDYLFMEHLVVSQKDLCAKIEIGESSLSRIKSGVKEVSDGTIRKMNEKFGGIFNLAYFRGEDVDMLRQNGQTNNDIVSIDHGSLVNAALAAKDETIQALHDQIDTKNELIDSLRQHLSDLRDKMHYGQSEYGHPGMMASEDLGNV